MAGLRPDSVYTDGDKKLEERRRNTHPGQAHWGGEGPKGKTCRECFHWGEGDAGPRGSPYFADTGGLKPRRCGRFFALTGQKGTPVPFEAKACRDFLEVSAPPKAYKYE